VIDRTLLGKSFSYQTLDEGQRIELSWEHANRVHQLTPRGSIASYPGTLQSSCLRSEPASDLADETAAQIEAIMLARSLRDARPELVGMNCSISVTGEDGGGICIIPLEIP
jgi:hypothetical protein